MSRIRKIFISLMLILLVLSPLYSAPAKTAAKPKTTQTSKQAPAKTNAKPSDKPASKPASATSAVESKYASEGNPEGWWNALWNDAHVSYDLFVQSTLLRGENVPGGGLSLGVETDKFRFETYGMGNYFMKPFAGNGGIAGMEISAEVGIDAAWKFLEFWSFDVWATCSVGYFTQLVKGLPYPPYDEMVMGYSGLMIRPRLLVELKIAKYYGLTAGFYYQVHVYPGYSDYSGLGIMFSIM